eukprot:jgi/Mesvir1/17266/Mv07675-RA.1
MSPNSQLRMGDATGRLRLPDAAIPGQLADPSLQGLAATPGVGESIMGGVPLSDRVRLRGLCRAFKAAVDASLRNQKKITAANLSNLIRGGQSDGQVLRWLAGKCPNLQALDMDVNIKMLPRLRWWTLPVADAIVTHLAAQCRQLRILSLPGCNGVGNAALRAVAANCAELRHLAIAECWNVTDAGVSAIADGCQQLEYLDVAKICVTDVSMMAIASRCPRLQHLCLHSQRVGDAGITAIASHCPRLRHLDVSCTDVGDAGITAIAQGCRELRSLNVYCCRSIGDDSFVAIAENCPQLETLKREGCSVRDRGIAAILSCCTQLREFFIEINVTDAELRLGPASCHQLQSLALSGQVTEVTAAVLAPHCSQLTSLSINTKAPDASLGAFAGCCPLLKQLCLGKVTDAGMLAVATHFPRLQSVNVWGCRGLTDASMTELVTNCPRLRRLVLSASAVGDRTVLAAGQHCPDLRILDLSYLPLSAAGNAGPWGGGNLLDPRQASEEQVRARDAGLACVLRNCLSLEVLVLNGCRGWSDGGIAVVGDGCKRLQELHLAYCRGCFTPRGLAGMAPRLGALERLHAPGCDAVTDESVIALAENCPRLSFVEVSGCKVGDRGILALVTRGSLLLKLRACGCVAITDASLMALSERCPKLEALMVSGCRGVTGAGARAVASKCREMMCLQIENCSLTVDDVQAVKGMRPHLETSVTPFQFEWKYIRQKKFKSFHLR